LSSALQTEYSGTIPAEFPEAVDWRSDSGSQYRRARVAAPNGIKSKFQPQYSLPSFNATRDLSGGFYEDGPYGPVKLTKSNALTVAMLAWAMLDAPNEFAGEPALLVRFPHSLGLRHTACLWQTALSRRTHARWRCLSFSSALAAS
jgi:hypothetical protein